MFKEAGPDADYPFAFDSEKNESPNDEATVAESLGAQPEQIAAMSPEAGKNKEESLASAGKISGMIGETVKNSSVLRNIATSRFFQPTIAFTAALFSVFLRGEFNDLSAQADSVVLGVDNYIPGDSSVFDYMEDPDYGENAKEYYFSTFPGMEELYEKARSMKDVSIGSAIVSLIFGGGAVARHFMKKRDEQ
ncbi:MAG: hypothetical protein MUD10_04345 [Candidatus Pacebacteria bacterium]|jgi:hypothetical protein|nr:hypothetical protein [Candidatus Paceibacterota bacterium]